MYCTIYIYRIPIHRCVLSAASDFFYTMFTTELNTPDQKEFVMKEINADILKQIIDFYYTRSITLDANNVEIILQWASQYLLTEIVNACSEYLSGRVQMSNCLRFWNLATLYNMNALETATKQMFADNFTVLTEGDDFLNAQVDALILYFKQNDLNIESEKEVFNAVLRWIDHSPDERTKHFSTLLNYIRITQIDANVRI